jgi:Outer membrane protein beta-barrel domain
MKKLLLIFLVSGMVSTASWASGVGLINSFWSPADFDSDFGPGVKLQADLDEIYHLEFRLTYYPDMGEDVMVDDEKVNVDLETMPLEFGLLVNIPYVDDPLIQSYLGGGFGYYLIDLSAKGPAGAINYSVDDEIGFYLLAGARLHFSPAVALFGDLMYRFVEGEAVTKREDGTKSEIDMNLTGPGVNIGIIVLF